MPNEITQEAMHAGCVERTHLPTNEHSFAIPARLPLPKVFSDAPPDAMDLIVHRFVISKECAQAYLALHADYVRLYAELGIILDLVGRTRSGAPLCEIPERLAQIMRKLSEEARYMESFVSPCHFRK